MSNLRRASEVATEKASIATWHANQAMAAVVKAERMLAAWRTEAEYRVGLAAAAHREEAEAAAAWAQEEAEKAVASLEEQYKEEMKP